MTNLHIANFVDAVRTGAPLHQPIEEGAKSVLAVPSGNIAHGRVARSAVDPATGHIQGDDAAMAYWQREYAPGLDSHSLNPDRSSTPIRRYGASRARLYEETRALPIVSPHGHVDPGFWRRTRHSPIPRP